MKYYWIVSKDLIHNEFCEQYGIPSRAGVSYGDKGLKGVNPATWSAYDDDDNCYYIGRIYGEYDGFEPLHDFATPDAGATYIKINGEAL